MKRTKQDKIILGSGKSYIMEYNVETGIPSVDEICVVGNELGKTKGGATLLYNIEVHDESDDLNTVAKQVIVAESASLKLGMITFNGLTLEKLVDRCSVSEAGGLRTIKIGGAGNAQGKDWVVCFKHEDKTDGNIWVIVRGPNQAGLELAFATDSGSKLEPEFKALPQDDTGTLITYIEEIDAAATTTAEQTEE